MLDALLRILGLVRKELLAILKDPRSRFVLFAPPIVQSLIFGYAASYDLNFVPYAVIDLAGLSFLGFGLQPPNPDWGNMLADASKSLLYAPWLIIFPGACVSLLALSWNIFGARLRRAIDPTLVV